MKSTALYFPYIKPPNDAWFRQMTLYWDSIGVILPWDYDHDPKRAPHFAGLLETGLLKAVRPFDHIPYIYEFGQDFLVHIKEKASREKQQPKWTLLLPYRVLVHAEKLDYLAAELIGLDLGKPAGSHWVDLDGWVAGEFMTYLACVVGRRSGHTMSPITNDGYCAALISGQIPTSRGIAPQPAGSVRDTLLGEILPSAPAHVPFEEIARFKEKHGDRLTRFRNRLEADIIVVSNVADADERSWLARQKASELRDEVDELAGRMRERWREVTFGTIFPLIGAGAQMCATDITEPAAWIGSVTGLASAGYSGNATIKSVLKDSSDPLAYGAYVKREFGKKSG